MCVIMGEKNDKKPAEFEDLIIKVENRRMIRDCYCHLLKSKQLNKNAQKENRP